MTSSRVQFLAHTLGSSQTPEIQVPRDPVSTLPSSDICIHMTGPDTDMVLAGSEFVLVSWGVNAKVHTKDSSRGKRTQEEGNRKSGHDGFGVKCTRCETGTYISLGLVHTKHLHLPISPEVCPGDRQHLGFKEPSLLSPRPGPEATLATFFLCVAGPSWEWALPSAFLIPFSQNPPERIPVLSPGLCTKKPKLRGCGGLHF